MAKTPGHAEVTYLRGGRAELQATTFDTFERYIRDQLERTLQDGDFDPARDITAITVDPEVPENETPHVLGRAPYGRMAIANSDAGGGAYTDSALARGHRAVTELLDL